MAKSTAMEHEKENINWVRCAFEVQQVRPGNLFIELIVSKAGY